jgi:hypothetical protein
VLAVPRSIAMSLANADRRLIGESLEKGGELWPLPQPATTRGGCSIRAKGNSCSVDGCYRFAENGRL